MSKKSTRVAIVEPGWQKYTGDLGGLDFVNGMSVEALTSREQMQMGASLQIAAIADDTPENADPIAAATAQVGISSHMQSVLDADRDHSEQEQVKAEKVKKSKAKDQKVKLVEDAAANNVHTAETLEMVADKGGIGALREIAATLDPSIKGRSIADLIKEIVKHNEKSVEREVKDASKAVDAAEKDAAKAAKDAADVSAKAKEAAQAASDASVKAQEEMQARPLGDKSDAANVSDGGNNRHDAANPADGVAGS